MSENVVNFKDEVDSIIGDVLSIAFEEYEDILSYRLVNKLKDGITSEILAGLDNAIADLKANRSKL